MGDLAKKKNPKCFSQPGRGGPGESGGQLGRALYQGGGRAGFPLFNLLFFFQGGGQLSIGLNPKKPKGN